MAKADWEAIASDYDDECQHVLPQSCYPKRCVALAKTGDNARNE